MAPSNETVRAIYRPSDGPAWEGKSATLATAISAALASARASQEKEAAP